MALAWELWRRHRARLCVMASVMVLFVLFYRPVCAALNFNLAANALDEVIKPILGEHEAPHELPRILMTLARLFVAISPHVLMVMSALYLVWVFTWMEFDAKRAFTFPSRLFTLPISSSFFVGWNMVAGTAALAVLFAGWNGLVGMPKLEVFDGCRNFGSWMTLLFVAQAIVWTCYSFPVTRVFLISGLLVCFLSTGPGPENAFYFAYRPLFLATLLPAGAAFAFAGFSRMRHGSWAGWKWPRWLRSLPQRATAVGPKTFTSPFHAQVWFEWRTRGQRLFWIVVALLAMPLLILAICRVYYGTALDGDATYSLCVYMLAVPLFIHFADGLPSAKLTPAFVMIRPLRTGELLWSKLAAMGLSTVLCWAAAGAAAALALVAGDMRGALLNLRNLSNSSEPGGLIIPLLLAAFFLTWRASIINLWYRVTRNWVSNTVMAALIIVMTVEVIYATHGGRIGLGFVTGVLLALILIKAVIAPKLWASALRARLVSRRALIGYLCLCAACGGIFLSPLAVKCWREPWFVAMALLVPLLLPIGRIAWAALALDRERHG
jgi:hypothetical protein